MMGTTAKPVNFKFNEYLNSGFELLKNNFGNMLLAYLFCFIMSIIPFCGILAIGNFYKYCRKLRKGEPAGAGEIFNFDDFVPYFILQLIIFAAVFVIYIPFLFTVPFMEQGEEPSPMFMAFFVPYMIIVGIVFMIVALKAFYIPGLISLKGVKDIKTAWNMSKIMTKDNLLTIFLFALVVGILAQLGVILCVIGIFITIPYMYACNYFAFEDGIQQIEYDEIKEIGSKNEY